MWDSIIWLLKLFFYVVFNPFTLFALGMTTVMGILIRLENSNKTLKWGLVSIVVFLFLTIIFWTPVQNYKKSNREKENAEKIAEYDRNVKVSKRTYYISFDSVRTELEHLYLENVASYTSMDTLFWEIEDESSPISLSNYLLNNISNKEKAERSLVNNIYLPFLDSLYSYLDHSDSFYLGYVDTSFRGNDRFIDLYMHYECDTLKGEAHAVLDIQEMHLKILKFK